MAHNLRSRKIPEKPSDTGQGDSALTTGPVPADSPMSDADKPAPAKAPASDREEEEEEEAEVTDASQPRESEGKSPPTNGAVAAGNNPRPWSTGRMLAVLLLFRWVNAFLTQTHYVPDEYWQSLEVAHNLAFGYGYLTWEWKVGLRGFTFPAIFAILYKVLHVLNLDHPVLLVLLPKILQATFSAIGDFYLYKLAHRLCGESVARWVLFSHLSSWFVFYTAARTLTNTGEMILTVCAMYHYPWPRSMLKSYEPGEDRYSTGWYLLLASTACIVRPTAGIVWLPLCLWHLARCQNFALAILIDFVPISSAALSCSLLLDRLCYGKWVFVHFNFLRFNALYNVGAFYGTQPWHWYLTQGLPVIVGTHVFAFVLGMRMAGRAYRPLVLLIVWTLFIYSLLQHKEYRFLLPILPIVMLFCGVCLRRLSKSGRATSLVLFILATNLAAGLYAGLVHQRGTLDVMGHLQGVAHAPNAHIKVPSVLFLMPCHSTPFFSHVHANITLRFLECPPSLARYTSEETLYLDEADHFYESPADWLKAEYRPGSRPPRHLIFYDVLLPKIKKFLTSRGYSKAASFFHTHVPLESRIGKNILVYTRPLKIPLAPA